MSALQTLMEMGFSENASKKALAVAGGGGIEQAMEWILAHADDPAINDEPADAAKTEGKTDAEAKENTNEEANSKEDTSKESTNDEGTSQEVVDEGTSEEAVAKSIKCDDCGKIFRTNEEVEFHAVKSGHENFSESTEEKKPLTEEEKLQKKMELAEKIKQRRKEREAEEEKESILREKKRIEMGQAMAERKRAMQDLEIKKLAEERRRDKMEDKLARQRVKEQIERDRQARKEMYANKNTTEQPQVAAPVQQPAAPAQKKEYTTTRLQIRLPTGAPLVQEFKAKEALSAVRLWVGLNRQDGIPPDAPINFSLSFPRKTFSEEDMDKPLDVLGLVPSAVLMVSK